MEADELLRRKGLEVPVFVPPSDPPWTWGGVLGYGPPMWIPKIPGARWVGAVDALATAPADNETLLAIVQSQAELLARAHASPSDEPLSHSILNTPSMRQALAQVGPVNRLLDESNGPMWMPQLALRLGRNRYGRPRMEDERPDRVQRIAWLKDLCDHGVTRRRGSKLVHERGPWSIKALARALYGDDTDKNRKMATREIAAGQRLLHEHAVIPWVAWEDGRLPTKWWREPSFRQAVAVWTTYGAITAGIGRLAFDDPELVEAARQKIAQAG
jgi:hypothetical protein